MPVNHEFSFHLAVRVLMRRRGMKQTDMAKLLGVRRATVTETICRDKPTVATCEKYAAALGVSLAELVSAGYRPSLGDPQSPSRSTDS